MEEGMQNLSLHKSLTTVYPETGIQDKSIYLGHKSAPQHVVFDSL